MTAMVAGGPAKKGEAALSLRLAGASVSEIASFLKYRNEQAVRQDINSALAAGIADADRAHHRELATLRLEQILRAIYPKAINQKDPEQLPAARAARELIHEIATLQGAAQPAQVVVSNPNTDELLKWIGRMTKDSMPEVVEADPFEIEDAEVVDEDPPPSV